MAPIPEEILEKISFVGLNLKPSDSESVSVGGRESGNPHGECKHQMRKKDRRKQRREQWLQSRSQVLCVCMYILYHCLMSPRNGFH